MLTDFRELKLLSNLFVSRESSRLTFCLYLGEADSLEVLARLTVSLILFTLLRPIFPTAAGDLRLLAVTPHP